VTVLLWRRLGPALLSMAAAWGLGCQSGVGATAAANDAAAVDGGDAGEAPPADAAAAPPADAMQADQSADVEADGATETGDASETVAGCHHICDAEAMIVCPRPRLGDCLDSCVSMIDGRCKNTERKLIACASHVTVADFICDRDGYAEIKPEVCVPESMALATCIMSGVDPP
jgi:hypothetical protein